jgi:hypothetical protein
MRKYINGASPFPSETLARPWQSDTSIPRPGSETLRRPQPVQNIDAISQNGDRYSIKTRMKAKKTRTIYPDGTTPDKQLFEYILLVRIDENCQLISIHQFT